MHAPAERLGVLIDTCRIHAPGSPRSRGGGDRLADALVGEGSSGG